MVHRMAVIVADGVNGFELSVASQIFGSIPPDSTEGWYELGICSQDGKPVQLAGGLTLSVHHDYSWAETADTVIVPAWPCAVDAPNAPIIDFIRRVRPEETRLVSFCSGAFLLAEAGLLSHRRATTHWLHSATLQNRHPDIKVDQDRLYTEDRNVFTSAGSSAALDLCLFLVSKDLGADHAAELARRLVLAPHRAGGQNQFVTTGRNEVEEVNPIAEATDWAQEHLHETIRVRDLSKRANMSERTFSRQFDAATGMSPINWLHLKRIEKAKQLLEVSDMAIPMVASKVGLGSAANLRQHFSRHVGVSPTSYRQSFALTRFDQRGR